MKRPLTMKDKPNFGDFIHSIHTMYDFKSDILEDSFIEHYYFKEPINIHIKYNSNELQINDINYLQHRIEYKENDDPTHIFFLQGNNDNQFHFKCTDNMFFRLQFRQSTKKIYGHYEVY